MSAHKPRCQTKWSELIVVDPTKCKEAYRLLLRLEAGRDDAFDEYMVVRDVYTPPNSKREVYQWVVPDPRRGNISVLLTSNRTELEDVCRMLCGLISLTQAKHVADLTLENVRRASSMLVYLYGRPKMITKLGAADVITEVRLALENFAAYFTALLPDTPVQIAYPLLAHTHRELFVVQPPQLAELKAALLLHEGKSETPQNYDKMLCASCVSTSPVYKIIMKNVPQIPAKSLDHRCVQPSAKINVQEWFENYFLPECPTFSWSAYKPSGKEKVERQLREAVRKV